MTIESMWLMLFVNPLTKFLLFRICPKGGWKNVIHMFKHLTIRVFSKKKYNRSMSPEKNKISKFWPLGKDSIIINIIL